MIEKFNGIIYLIIFLVHFLAYAVYAFRCVFGTRAFIEQYGMGDGSAIMTRFFGSIFVGSVLMAIYVGFIRAGGLDNTWAFFNLIFLQNASAFVFAIWSHQKGNLGVNEKTSIEGIIAPGILTLLSAVLCYGLADKIYS
tara:strand:- start:503 stop:919 length:417 start_codon:yes stop_codon:yes gene_type:complete